MQLSGDNILLLTADEFHDLMASMNIGRPNNIAVAVSGGGDSMALTLLLNQWCLKKNIKLNAVTVDHSLREASKQEAENVSTWLRQHKIDHEVIEWVGKKPQSNIQDAAREARYKLINQWCSERKIQHLFVAHHKDDQAETFFIRLLRGSGVDGLSAMKPISLMPHPLSHKNDVKLYRPLLSIGKERLLKTLDEFKQRWISDPSNENENFTRIKVRKLLENSEIEGLDRDKLAATAEKMSRVKSLLDELTDQAESDYVQLNPLGYAELSQYFYENLHEEISLRLLSRLLKKISGGTHPTRYQKLLSLYESIKKPDFAGQTLAGVIIFKTDTGQITFVREAASIRDNKVITGMKQYLWDNRFLINAKPNSGTLLPFSEDLMLVLNRESPAIKDEIFQNFKSHILRDKVLPSLPVILTNDQKVILPKLLCSDKNNNSDRAFSASFQL